MSGSQHELVNNAYFTTSVCLTFSLAVWDNVRTFLTTN